VSSAIGSNEGVYKFGIVLSLNIYKKKQKQNADEVHHPDEKINQIKI
jgi:hypothetical protein